jgi:flavin reductase (DIM6/NTAB) family NADH-FMN oxidoreductase RutF/rubredoxin
MQITSKPTRISVAVNKSNFTHDMIAALREFNVNTLSESATFRVFERFGFKSGRDSDKFDAAFAEARTANGIRYLPKYANAVISAKVTEMHDYATHTLFVAEVTESRVLNDENTVTYRYYHENIKPKPQPIPANAKAGFVCKICRYVLEGSTLPEDFICPLCKHGAADFEKM